tara:strand:- start:79 stop:546 length:468 start_codon:yes stop_codon:yes gene_type:complete
MHGNYQSPEYLGTQVSCVARMQDSSQILAILFRLLGAFREMDTLNKQRNEVIPKTPVASNADSPSAHEAFSKDSEPGDFPACIIANVTRLVNCPTISIDADASADGSAHLLVLGLIPDLVPDLCSLYDDSSRFDHLDRGDVPINAHNSAIYWLVD